MFVIRTKVAKIFTKMRQSQGGEMLAQSFINVCKRDPNKQQSENSQQNEKNTRKEMKGTQWDSLKMIVSMYHYKNVITLLHLRHAVYANGP